MQTESSPGCLLDLHPINGRKNSVSFDLHAKDLLFPIAGQDIAPALPEDFSSDIAHKSMHWVADPNWVADMCPV
jgi:hypothetical protein